MDELLRQALERRERLWAELQTLDQFIRSYAEVKERAAPQAMQADLFAPAKRQSFRARRAIANSAAMGDAERLIIESGRPMSRTDLLKALTALGHEIEGADKSKVLGTNIWRSKQFYNLKGAGYWPISAPIPDGFRHLQTRESMLLDGEPE